ncbi:hypothetical protein X943_000150 [Babesia divergens]|uniref:Uncharacterized protein n=1 Tax=Babesia divergens TaxID=32595 RepID=A0AAD9GCM8_BABDI|nr:hypothetical protein X943_000150 [Babesia divergens]
MSAGTSLDDIAKGCSQLTDIRSIKAYFLTIVAAQQQELQRTKAAVKDFRAVHNFDHLYEQNAAINALIDPVVNSEILHLKQLLHVKDEELKAALDAKEGQKYNPQSAVGKALLDRCRVLITENEELGRIVLESQVQPLTLDLFKERQAAMILRDQLKGLHQYNDNLEEENQTLAETLEKKLLEISFHRMFNYVSSPMTCNIYRQELQAEKEALAHKLEELQMNYDTLSSKKAESNARVSESKGHKEDKSRYDRKSRTEDKRRRDDTSEYEQRESKYKSSNTDEKREVDKKDDRHDPLKKQTSQIPAEIVISTIKKRMSGTLLLEGERREDGKNHIQRGQVDVLVKAHETKHHPTAAGGQDHRDHLGNINLKHSCL